jgi:asparagine synthase (glutamine-hydrolysing)
MCGIAGSTARDAEASVRAMCVALRHRGPDDEGIHVDAGVHTAIGATRLAIVDVAGGHQPLGNEDGTVWAVLNGEIYNHPSLRTHLLRGGHLLRTRTDTEVLVHLYEDYGDELVHALEGMYAFAIWDSRRRRLLLGRDRFGEKPLFYTERGGALRFASELTALRRGTPGSWELDPAAVDDAFVHGYVRNPATIVAGAVQLPPAHTLVWERGQATLRRYWDLPATPVSGGIGVVEAVREVERQLGDSVRSRLLSDVPVGVLLSGGLDSTLVTALAVREWHGGGSGVPTFTVGYDTGSVDEVLAARRTAAALGTEHHEVRLSSGDVADRLGRVLRGLDQPVADPALVALQAVCESARQRVTVALGGEGADELFAGYPRYRWLARWAATGDRLPASLRPAAASAARALPGRGRRLADLLSGATLDDVNRDWMTQRRAAARPAVYGGRLRRDLEAPGAPAPVAADRDPNAVAAALMRLDRHTWLPDDVLAKADRAAMMVSLELRTPYLHRGLAELAAAVSPAVHQADGGKALLRAVLRRVAPALPARRKRAFGVPVAEWLRGPLQPMLAAQVEGGTLYAEGWFDRDAVRRLAAEHTAGTRDHSAVLWPLLILGGWLDHAALGYAAEEVAGAA